MHQESNGKRLAQRSSLARRYGDSYNPNYILHTYSNLLIAARFVWRQCQIQHHFKYLIQMESKNVFTRPLQCLLSVFVAQIFVFAVHSAQVESSMLPAVSYPAVISPDGQWAAYTTGGHADGGICTVKVASPNVPVCAQVAGPPLLEFIVWSHDSSQLVFANESFASGFDSDIYLLIAGETTIINLTSEDQERDGLEGRQQGRATRPDRESALLIDTAPAWSHDGESIFFLRFDSKSSDRTLWLMEISAQGGEPVRKSKIDDNSVYSIGTLSWMNDSTLLLTSWMDGTLIQLDVGSNSATQHTFLTEAGHSSPHMLSISSNSEFSIHTLWFFPSPMARGPLFFLVNWQDQSITDIQDLITNSSGRAYWPVLLPEGTSKVGDIVYFTPLTPTSANVMLLDVESGEAVPIAHLEGISFSGSSKESVQFIGEGSVAITTADGTWLFSIPSRFLEPL